MPEPDPDAEWWTTSDVAAYLGVQIGTVSAYRSRGQMPAPTRTLGRTHLWRPLEIKAWRSPGADAVTVEDESLPLKTGDPWRRHGERTIYDSEWVRLDLVDIEQPGGSRFEHHEAGRDCRPAQRGRAAGPHAVAAPVRPRRLELGAAGRP